MGGELLSVTRRLVPAGCSAERVVSLQRRPHCTHPFTLIDVSRNPMMSSALSTNSSANFCFLPFFFSPEPEFWDGLSLIPLLVSSFSHNTDNLELKRDPNGHVEHQSTLEGGERRH